MICPFVCYAEIKITAARPKVKDNLLLFIYLLTILKPAIPAFYRSAEPEDCLHWFFMLIISFVKMAAAPRANIAKTISIGPKKKTTAAPIAQPANGHSTISRNLLFLVPGSSSNIAIPEAKPEAVTTGADSQQRTFANKGPNLSTGMATANQPV